MAADVCLMHNFSVVLYSQNNWLLREMSFECQHHPRTVHMINTRFLEQFLWQESLEHGDQAPRHQGMGDS